MKTSFVTLAGLCALAVAAPGQIEDREANPSLSSLLAQISSLSLALNPPTKIAADLATGIPTSALLALSNPTAGPAYLASVASAPPAWFSSLPTDAQAYIVSVAPKYASLVSLEIAAGLITVSAATATGNSPAKATNPSSGDATTGADATKKATATGTGSSAASKSSAGAATTNRIAVGLVGAISFLGLALAL